MLIDMKTYVIIRMFKGYREAQVGFIEEQKDKVEENEEESQKQEKKRKPLFLVIYAQRRGLLEVWRMKNGPREAMVNVGLGCKLLTTNKVFGTTVSTHQYSPSKLYLLHAEGNLEEIVFSEFLHQQIKKDKNRQEKLISLVKSLLENASHNELGEIEITGGSEEQIEQLFGGMVHPKIIFDTVKKFLLFPFEFEFQWKMVSSVCEHVKKNEEIQQLQKQKNKKKHYQENTHELEQLKSIEKMMIFYEGKLLIFYFFIFFHFLFIFFHFY